jgi:hypothetical protein|tara:strand:- start:806 stop:1006 length:201 start_codon:yes stop_codon:yes gene_type:complete
MIDKVIQKLTKQPNPAAQVQDEVSRPNQVAGGIDKFKKDKGINLKKGGIVCRGQGMAKNKKITKMY